MARSVIKSGQIPPLVRRILVGRGYQTEEQQREFLNPDYDATDYDPLLLPGMRTAAERLLLAAKRHEQVTIYCDYDVDGTTACAVLMDALPQFGIKCNYYVPDRFAEGYGLNKVAIKKLKEAGTDLLLTVDNGIVSFDEAAYAKELGLDLIITDHHTPREAVPDCVAVVDPKIAVRDYPNRYDEHFMLKPTRPDVTAGQPYPFCDLCGCGVAFKLVQALQKVTGERSANLAQQLAGQARLAASDSPGRPGNQGLAAQDCCSVRPLAPGQEKWLLDLVALATVADVVSLVDENRAIVYWGLQVLKKTRRPGLKALAAVAGVDLDHIDARAIGFMLGPRINAAGRLAHAKLAVQLLTATDNERALELAQRLADLNDQRKKLQLDIYNDAITQVNLNEPVAIAVGNDWHEGVIGIVASKVEEKVERPTFIFSRHGDEAKASGRSFGDFSLAAAINATSTLLERGGGHAAACGVTVKLANLKDWCQAVNDYYRSLKLTDQVKYLYPKPDVVVTDFSELTVDTVTSLRLLEPCGAANPVPTFELQNVIVSNRRLMGADMQHVRYTFLDSQGNSLQCIAFNAADRFTIEPGEFGQIVQANVLVELDINEWNGSVSVQGKLIKIDEA